MKYLVAGIVNWNELYEGRIFDNKEDADAHKQWLMDVEMYRESDIIYTEVKK